MRKNKNFPLKDNFLCTFLNEIWDEGWLDEFDDEHFLIKAIYDKADDFEGYTKSKQNNFNTYEYSNDFSLNFSINISRKLDQLTVFFGRDKIKNFVENTLSAGKENYNEEKFFRALAEMEIFKHHGNYGPANILNAMYKPYINKNDTTPKARFCYEDGTTLDLEIKTTGFCDKRNNGRVVIPSVVLDKNGKQKLEEYSKKNNIECVMPRVNKLVDFINSAAKKFENFSSDKHVNLLYINWSYKEFPANSYLEAYSILYNDLNGLLKHKDIGISMGISEEAYEKISAVIVYTTSLNAMSFQDFKSLWPKRNFVIMPIKHNQNQLIRITHMDYNKNKPLSHLLGRFKDETIEDYIRGERQLKTINNIIKEHFLKI